ncbi:glycosyltransferase family 2 protein [Oricola sp.]|uniref:glycosyltransferase family 2 protein n=1 Tax=Oricola sp. TaxID=1979950 RepID=UPI003BACC4D2
MSDKQSKISFITTCKGRLEHLKETLPRLVSFEGFEVVVVDFDCPQGTRDFVRETYPQVTVVEVDNEPVFNASKARNRGAEAATADRLFFVDADIVLAPGVLEMVEKVPTDHFGEFLFRNDVRGTCVVPRQAYDDVGGYDEVMQGYCGEDVDLYHRFELLGYNRHKLPDDGIERVIEHSDLDRITNYGTGRKVSFAKGKLYREVKSLLMRLEMRADISLELRRQIWQRVDEMFRSEDVYKTGAFLDIPLPKIESPAFIDNCHFTRSLRFTAKVDLE